MKRLLNPVVAGALVAAAVAALAGLARLSPEGPFDLASLPERLLLDVRLRLRGPHAIGPEVALVALDDKTSHTDQSLVERRAGIARLIRAIHAAGAKVIGLDVFFNEPEEPVDPALARDVLAYLDRCAEGCAGGEGLELLRRLRAELTGDAEVAAALREAGDGVLAITAVRGDPANAPSLPRGRYGQSVTGRAPPLPVEQVSSPLAVINDAAMSLGFVNVEEDRNRIIRDMAAGRSVGTAVYAPLAVQLVAAYLRVARARVVYDGTNGQVLLGERSIPFEDDGRFLLNPRGPAGTFPTWSAVDVVRGQIPKGALAGRIVLVGITLLGHDRASTALGDEMPGAEVHAALVDNILRGDLLRRGPRWADALACLLLGLLVSVCFWPRLLPGALAQIGASLGATALWLGVAQLALSRANLWFSWFWPATAGLLGLATCLSVSYATEGRQRRRLRRAFSHYLADEVIREFEKSGQELRLGGERRVLTALFSDIRGFTTLSERLDPMQLVRFLNTHLGAMTGAVLSQGGLLNKYIGDALMAFFGAPVAHGNHVERALAAALSMHKELEALNAGPFREMGLKVAVGVGLNTGEMVVGNVGSRQRVDFTVIGDAVNLASRVEGLNKEFGTRILITEATHEWAKGEVEVRGPLTASVPGREQDVVVHEVVGWQRAGT